MENVPTQDIPHVFLFVLIDDFYKQISKQIEEKTSWREAIRMATVPYQILVAL